MNPLEAVQLVKSRELFFFAAERLGFANPLQLADELAALLEAPYYIPRGDAEAQVRARALTEPPAVWNGWTPGEILGHAEALAAAGRTADLAAFEVAHREALRLARHGLPGRFSVAGPPGSFDAVGTFAAYRGGRGSGF